MPHDRFFSDDSLNPSTSLLLEAEEAHHLSRVMRAQEGDHVTVINGRGQLAEATVTKLHRKQAELLIGKVQTTPKTLHPITLLQALPRPNRLEMIIEKSTELGVDRIHLFRGKRSETNTLSDNRLKRLRQIAIAATKQCGRLYLPEIRWLDPIQAWTPFQTTTFFGDIQEDAPAFEKVWEMHHPATGVQFAIGPEGGFHKDEEASLRQLGARGVRLHPLILRTDTAPIVALSLIQHWMMQRQSG